MEEETGQSLKEQLENVERVIKDFENRIYLDKINLKEVDLNIGRDTLLKMDAEDIYAMCVEFAQYSLGLQREINRQNARYYWVESVLDKYLSEQSQEYKGFSFAERKMYCLGADSYAQKLNRFKESCKLSMDRTMYLTSKIDFLTKMASSVADMKRRNKDG